jgi:hypothetical protein
MDTDKTVVLSKEETKTLVEQEAMKLSTAVIEVIRAVRMNTEALSSVIEPMVLLCGFVASLLPKEYKAKVAKEITAEIEKIDALLEEA